MADIKIKVEGRIATNLTSEVKLVTKNDGYTVEFEFDETWSVSSLKTALFIANGHCIPVPFVGNVCNVPMLVGVELLNVGVKSDDVLGLQTTTAAKVLCTLSADDLVIDEIPAPRQSIYDRIVEMINEGMVKGDKGEKGDKGDKGDAGAIKFVTVVSLPTENIQYDAIYLVPIENADGENRFTEYAYIDGKWETLGAISIQVDHSEYVKFTDYATESKAGVVRAWSAGGIGINPSNGNIYLAPASEQNIDNGTPSRAPITVENYKYAVRKSLTTNTETLTDDEKASACDWIGATPIPKAGGENGTFCVLMPNGTIRKVNLAYANYPSVNGVPVYNPNKTIMVNNAVADTDAPNWGQVRTYVDGKLAELLARIEALEAK